MSQKAEKTKKKEEKDLAQERRELRAGPSAGTRRRADQRAHPGGDEPLEGPTQRVLSAVERQYGAGSIMESARMRRELRPSSKSGPDTEEELDRSEELEEEIIVVKPKKKEKKGMDIEDLADVLLKELKR